MRLANSISLASITSVIVSTVGIPDAVAQQNSGEVKEIALIDEKLNEIVREGAQVSGAVVAGFLARSDEQAGPFLNAYLPKDWSENEICATVITIDGLYTATGRYEVPAEWRGGIARLEYETEYSDLLQRKKADTLAARISLGGCDDAGGGAVSVALWNTDELNEVTLLLNSFRADEVFVYVGNSDVPVRCLVIESSNRTAFDTKCVIDTDSFGGNLDLQIFRVVDGNPAPPDELTVYLPEH